MPYLLELLERVTPAFVPRFLFGVTYALAFLTAPSVLLRRRGNPRAALSWLLALFALPLLGVFCWWAFGRTDMERRKRRRGRSKREFLERHGLGHSQAGTSLEGLVPPKAVGDSVFTTEGNEASLCIDGRATYPALESAFESARTRIHAVFYIWRDDRTGRRLRDLLVARAKAGIAVRILVDAWGSPGFTKKFSDPLRDAGARVAAFLPSHLYPLRAPRFNFCNHRKIVIVDETVAFTGGMNVGDEYANEWRDLMVRVRGPAVHALEHVFLDDWFFAARENVPHLDTPAPPRGNVGCAVIASGPDRNEFLHDAFFIAFTRAERRVWIATPYFIPTQALSVALRTAAHRGLDVRLLLPFKSDVPLVRWASRSFYPDVLASGVRIFEYQGKMMHAKAFVVDDALSSIGSANVDSRSFRLSFEIGCLLRSPEVNADLTGWFDALFTESEEVTLRDVERTGTPQKLLESVAHLLSPLL